MLKLFHYFRSSASFRVRIALNLKNLSYQSMPIHLVNNGGEQNSPAFKEINPQGLVPVLQDGNKTISQSLAIIEYLEDLYPTPALLPKDPYLKAFARSLALIIAAEIHPLNNLSVLNYLKSELGLSEEQKTQWYQHWIAKGLAAFEKQLTIKNISGDFCVGNTPTIADVFLVPQLFNARRFNCDINSYPTLMRIDAHCQTLEPFKKAWPVEETA